MTQRWFPEGQQEWREEKEPSFLHPSRPRVSLHESRHISGAWTCTDCGGNGRCECPSVDDLRAAGAL